MKLLGEPLKKPSLAVGDFIILSDPFKEIIQDILPVPASVQFVISSPRTNSVQAGDFLENSKFEQSKQEIISEKPKKTKREIIYTLHLDDGTITIKIRQISPDVLLKMSNGWLRDFQHQLVDVLKREKISYIDQRSQLYNQHALSCIYNIQSHFSSFAFVQVGVPSRSASVNFVRADRVDELLRAISPGYLFSCGFMVYGVLPDKATHQENKNSLRLLQKTIKREGFKKIQVGITKCNTGEDFVDLAWEAMLTAEKRGPFGFCDQYQYYISPFSLPSHGVLNKLRQQWRAQNRFAIAVFSVADRANVEQIAMELEAHHDLVYYDQGETADIFLYFGYDQVEELQGRISELRDSLSEKNRAEVKAIGCARWPTLSYNKTETVCNCLKSLLHCSFYEKGSIVFFDQLTLNVSGDYFFEQGDYHAAVKDYRMGLKIDPDNVELLNSLGVSLTEFNQFAKAKDCFKSALQIDPDHFMALANLGLAQISSGEKKQAAENLEKALGRSSFPDRIDPEVLLPLARIYTEDGKNNEALELLEVWKQNPGRSTDIMLFRLLSENYLAAGKIKEAILNCQKALQVYPEDSICMSILGLSYIKQEQGDDVGVSLCRKALSIDDANADNHFRMAAAYFALGKIDQAQQFARSCLRLNPVHRNGNIIMAKTELGTPLEKKAMKRLLRLQKNGGLSTEQEKEIRSLLC